MRVDIETLLGDYYNVDMVDGLWIALVAFEAGIIVCVLIYRILQARNRKAMERNIFFSTLPSWRQMNMKMKGKRYQQRGNEDKTAASQ
ncbi:hypothetical protein F4808DRAFT_463343 [Astrocystis sublimbata]|nr:hypothetical protein F4808DRAFT_463343 [Astrocystis sublimbata]